MMPIRFVLPPNHPFFHDGTERPITRPTDVDEQRFHYSGKKKQHTLKNLLLIADGCRICFLSTTYEGTWHDKAMADQESYALPPSSVLYQDLGFQGFTVAGSTIAQPKKKPRGGTLTLEEKSENRRLASIRIRIQHVIGSVKRYRIVKDKLRLWREHVRDQVMEPCCGLMSCSHRMKGNGTLLPVSCLCTWIVLLTQEGYDIRGKEDKEGV
jgi:hypothetical protein